MKQYKIKFAFLIPAEKVIELKAENKEDAIRFALKRSYPSILITNESQAQPNYYIEDEMNPLATSVGIKVEED